MEINHRTFSKPTIIASTLVIISSLGVGLFFGIVAYYLGSKSLVGVTSPSENPTQKISGNNSNLKETKPFTIMSEKSMLVKVHDYIEKERKASKIQEKSN